MSTPAAAVAGPERRLLARLADLSQRLAVSIDLEQTLTQVAELIAESMDAEASAVFLIDEAQQRIVCRACAGPVDITGLSLRMDQGLVGRAIARRESEVVGDAGSDPDFAGHGIAGPGGFVTRSVLTAPIMTSEGVIGALQVLNKRGGAAFTVDDADALRLLAAPTALALNHARLAAVVLSQNRIRRELTMARRLQRSLLPKRRRGSFPLRALNFPAREISGDFYDFFELPDGRIAFTLGDVAGKGLDAAFLMVRCASLLRWAGKEGLPPSLWLERANNELLEAIAAGMFVCAVAGYYDPFSQRLCWANGGFPPLLRVDRSGQFQQFEAEGPPLGILAGMQYPQQETTLDGAALYLFSDGMTDVRGDDGQLLGVEGVQTAVAEMRLLPPEARLRALVRRLRKMTMTDDTTLMVIEGEAAVALRTRFPAQAESLQPMRHAADAALQQLGVEAGLRASLVLALDEACANIIRHAFRGGCGRGQIELVISSDGDELRFVLVDNAPCVDPEAIRPRDLDECRPGGLGVCFIDALMDSWRISPLAGGGNRLLMRKRLETAPTTVPLCSTGAATA
ncbi:SpoIIE family protein phosphatase [Aquimonas sp.]|jgi:sigma-B regulation protein RsbU (phosphoserine phosphatase)|uniref:ATP-binding SpoIIE family protein phosphatase n=1 Tax=Aquimonas sp. TaxID=1872588 RepID=UPI0037BF7D3C